MESDPQASSGRKRKKRETLAVPLPIAAEKEPAATDKADKPKPSVFEEALANLATRKQEAAEKAKAARADEAEKPGSETTETTEPAAKQAEEQRASAQENPDEVRQTEAETVTDEPETEADEASETLPLQEKQPNELSGGEVVIQLQGDAPVEERVIPLRAEAAEPSTPAPAAAAETPADFTTEPAAAQETTEQPPSGPAASPETAEPAPESPKAPQPPTGETAPVPPLTPSAPAEAALPPSPPHSERPGQTDILPPVETVAPASEDIIEPAARAESVQTLPPGERPATKREVEMAMYQAEKAGQNRGVLFGLLVSNFLHRRRDKRQAKRFQRQVKRLEKEQATQRQAVEQQQTHPETVQQMAPAERPRPSRFESSPSLPAKPEAGQAVARPEQPFQDQLEKLLPKNPEQPRKPEPEPFELPPDHRLETSAWHTIEVDAKTGRAVEQPTFTYGHEYYQERAHEATPKADRNAAAGEVALVAAAMGQEGESPDSSGNNGNPYSAAHIPSASTQGPPSNETKEKAKAAIKKTASKAADAGGPLWPWLVALVVIIILLAALIH